MQTTITINSIVLKSSDRAYVANAVSLTNTITTSGVNGLDTGSEASSTWYNVWIIYNGTTVASLLSLSATAPTMPSGYTYKARVGAIWNDGSSNLFRTLQYDKDVQVIVGTNPTTINKIATGITLNTSKAITVLHGLAKSGNIEELKSSAQILGLLSDQMGAWVKENTFDLSKLEEIILASRDKAMKTKEFTELDNLKNLFILNLNANATYNIKLSYLGMQNKEITVTTQTQNITQNITMESGGIDLEGVEIVREMPVSIKGDTIVYNSDSFTNGTERKLEDVLKKLPGVEVDADGQVKVEGKSVTKLMVEGKDFFDGDTKLATKNIPADALEKIQVLRNYNDENNLLKDEYSPFQYSGEYPDLFGRSDPKLRNSLIKEVLKSNYKRYRKRKGR